MRKLTVYAFTTAEGADKLEALKPKVGGMEIFPVRGDGIAAVVARRRRQNLLKTRIQRAATRLQLYQRVLEEVRPDIPVLPAKFETVLPGIRKVETILKIYADEIRKPLRSYGRLIQYEVLATWPVEDVIRRLRQDGVMGLKFGAGTVMTEEIKKQIDTVLSNYKQTVFCNLKTHLNRVALDLIETPRMEEEVVLNMTVLMRPEEEPLFDQVLTEFDTQTDGLLTIKCIGPLPPCSFASVEVSSADLNVVEAARRRLNLNPSASWTEIRDAYHRAMKALHPDLNGTHPNVSHRMGEIREAYKLLNRIAAGQAGAVFNPVRQPAKVVRFDAETLGQTYTVRLRRQDENRAHAA